MMKRIFAGLLLLICFAYIVNAARLGLANTAYFQARFQFEAWLQKPQTINEDNFKLARDFAIRSVQLAPNNPHYLITKAKIDLWGFNSGFATAGELRELDGLYKSAITLRPKWPEAYADYAWFLANVTNDLTAAWPILLQAIKYGPYHPDTLETAVNIAFSHWYQLTPLQKAQTYSWLANGLQTSAQFKIIELIKQSNLQFATCYYLKRKGNLSAQLWKSIEPKLCLIKD